MEVNDLPVEIIYLIFSHLDVYSRCVCRRVCKLWNTVGSDLHLQLAIDILNPTPPKFLREMYQKLPPHSIWWTPKFLHSNEKILESVLRLHIGRNPYISHYTHPTHNPDYILSPIGVANILKHAKLVQTLSFHGYFPFTTRVLSALQDLDSLHELTFQACETMAFPVREFTGPPSLERLTIQKYSIHLSGLLNFLSTAEPIEIDEYRDFEWNDILDGGFGRVGSNSSLNVRPSYSISLTYLNLSNCTLHSYFRWSAMASLEHLIIEDCLIYGQPLLMMPMFESAVHMKTVSFFGSKFLHAAGSEDEMSDQLMSVIYSVVERVESFGISHHSVVLERFIELLSASGQLKSLKIESHVGNIIEAAALFSQLHLSNLQSLELRCALPILDPLASTSENNLKRCAVASQLFESIPDVAPLLRELKITSYRGSAKNTEELILDDYLLSKFTQLTHLKTLVLSSLQRITFRGLERFMDSLSKSITFVHLGRNLSHSFGLQEYEMLRQSHPTIEIEYNPLIIENIPEPQVPGEYLVEVDHTPDSTCTLCLSKKCPFGCESRMPLCVIYDHSFMCTEMKRECSAGCGAMMKYREFASHYPNCTHNRIQCFGCQFEFQGKDYYQHRVMMDEDSWQASISGCTFRNFPYQCLTQCEDFIQCPFFIICCPACREDVSYQHYITSHQEKCLSKEYENICYHPDSL